MLRQEAAGCISLSREKAVERDKLFTSITDTWGPTLIGAPKVWDGTATDSGVRSLRVKGIIVVSWILVKHR